MTGPTAAVITVGQGRGFLVKTLDDRVLVVTAAHCLPKLPPAHAASFTQDRTYFEFLAPLSTDRPSVAAECVFVDPVADVAVLSAVDGQAIPDEDEAYEQLIEGRPTIELAAVTKRAPAYVLTLEGRWKPCVAEPPRRPGWTRHLTLIGAYTVGGMSGSPIINRDGRAIGVVVVGSLINGSPDEREHGQPALMGVLPFGILTDVLNTRRLQTLISQVEHQRKEWKQVVQRGLRRIKKGGQ